MSAHESEPIRRSIEVEYWVIDDHGRLVEPDGLTDAAVGVEREFVAPMLEIKTTPCASHTELRRELYGRIEAVLELADERGQHLVPLATPITADSLRDLPSDRTDVQAELIGEEFEYVRHCAGTHIHVEQQSGRAVEQLNTFIAIDPALALVNSAPYYRGEEVATGARSKLYRWLAYDNLPHQGRLWPYVDSKAEWNRRLERRHEEFTTAAVGAGVDRQSIEANFDPESSVWTPVQFRDTFDTVEWRSPDTALPGQVIQLADQLATITESLQSADVRIDGSTPEFSAAAVVLPEFSHVLDHVETAITDGLTDDLREYLDEFGFDVDAYEPTTSELAGSGHISREEAREIRLEHANRLEDDLNHRISAAGD
ncbi:glutamate-cysteine ligase family protein [Halovenus halobia]|uniref:glutamate-cysteine ligase family protein n=1 Tax=Halovenus halobia TaxID=3396622 RepID=UPI003F56DC82